MNYLNFKIFFLVCCCLALSSFFPLSSLAQVLPKNFSLTFEKQDIKLTSEEIQKWSGGLNLPANSNLIFQPKNINKLAEISINNQKTTTETEMHNFPFRLDNIYESLEKLMANFDHPPVEPELIFEDGRVVKFSPPTNGLFVNVHASAFSVLSALESGKNSTTLQTYTIEPKNKLSDTNTLGINELIARGESNFAGSSKNRRHNIRIGAEKFKGTVIKKGYEFSFNQSLGPIEAEFGFLPELVIKKTGTVPELGGGLCQVSSTTFRAAMEAGLPITQRKNHSYAVQYYSPQGTDATIYPGIIDLKFINDTPGDILIWPYLKDNNNLVFDFYGTKDNRKVTLLKPVQYDRKEDGSLKADWTRLIENNGIHSTTTFKSIYQSPILFKKQETFVSASTTQTNNMPVTN